MVPNSLGKGITGDEELKWRQPETPPDIAGRQTVLQYLDGEWMGMRKSPAIARPKPWLLRMVLSLRT
jgi:hypothetical protein